MNTFVAFLLLAALVAVLALVQKIVTSTLDAVARTTDKNLLYHSEVRQGRELVSESEVERRRARPLRKETEIP
jgi:hypothetical protein